MKRLPVAFALGFWTAALIGTGFRLGTTIPVPSCQEDQTIVGVGDFVDGQWSSYVCGPAVDDFIIIAPEGEII